MNKLVDLISEGEIDIKELANAQELIERAKLVTEGLEACKKTLMFPLGANQIDCYDYEDRAREYRALGQCTSDGMFICFCNWGGDHQIGMCDLTDFTDVFMAFENDEFASHLRRFLEEQIEKAR